MKSGSPSPGCCDPTIIFIDANESKEVHINGPFKDNTLMYVSTQKADSVVFNGSGERAIRCWRVLLALIADLASVLALLLARG